MKVIVSSYDRWHSFHLAEQLQKHGCLQSLITGRFDPSRNARGHSVDSFRVASNPFLFYLERICRRIYGLKETQFNVSVWNSFVHELYDNWVQKRLEPSDIVTGWSGFSLYTLRKARSQGAVTIVERGSSHPLYQKDILKEEHAQLGIKQTPVNDRLVERKLEEFHEADYICIPSSFVKRTFIERHFPEEKLIQVPYGVSLRHFRPVRKMDDVFRVMHIGCTPRKGTRYLIQAMAELDLKRSELVLIGSPSKRLFPMLKDYRKPYTIMNRVPHLKLYKLYSQSSVYVLPSIEEGLAMAQVEAMACGLPIICSTNTGGGDIVRDGVDGFVVPIRDVEALKEKILYLYEDEEARQSMAKSAMERATHFTWDRYGEYITEAYKRVLREG